MPKECFEEVGNLIGLYDSITDKSLRISRCVDISDLSNNKEGMKQLLYTEDTKGVIVQFVDENSFGKAKAHFHISINENFAQSQVFVSHSSEMGFDPDELYELALKLAPAIKI